ncbi:MAG TPA: hypothetical protein VGR49_03460 [Actinomycetota bacterium]|jgi:hypothetical protein|nr:hypothetical protein [Actinomycetota bacterium]
MGVLYHLKTLVARYPPLALPVARLRRGHGEVVSRDTEIVIEGFPRTGSSFAVAAFRRAQGRPVKVAHHVHAPAQVMVAVRWEIPALLLIRRPEDSVLSLVIRNPEIPISQALTGFDRFYRPLLPARDRFVTATFDEAIEDFGKVIDRINQRYSTSFVRFEHTEENAARVMAEIEEDYLTRDPPGERFERIVPRPSERRLRLKDELRERYRHPALSGARARAESLYARFVTG